MLKPDLYEVLGVPRDASKEDVRKAYRMRAKTAHPDAGGNRDDFELLNTAQDVLMDDKRREQYDRTCDFAPTTPDQKRPDGLARLAAAISNAVQKARERAENPFSLDILALAKNNMVDHRAQVEGQLGEFQAKLAFYTDLVSRFEKKDGDDPIRMILSGAVKQIQQSIVDCETEIAATDYSLTLFEGYSFRKDDEPVEHKMPGASLLQAMMQQMGRGSNGPSL